MVLINTKILFQGKLISAGIAIENGKIIKIAKDSNLPSASKIINLNGHITLPGLIDSHVHLRDQQLAYKEDFITGTSAAAVGGVTLVMDMPNNKPVTLDSLSLKKRMKIAEKKILVNTAFYSAFPKNLDEIEKIVKAGAIGFKIYMSNKVGGIDIDDDLLILEAFRRAANEGVPVAVHAEDYKILTKIQNEIKTKGRNETTDYMQAHPSEAEITSIQRILPIIRNSGVHVHFCHISSAKGLKVIMNAKKMGLPVTLEVTPHNLFLTCEEYKRSGTLALTDPPLRTQEDISALWSALKQGSIDIIASDHAPHDLKEKKVDSIWDVKSGIPGLETTFPLLLTQVNKGRLLLSDVIKFTATVPAKIFHLKKRGCIAEGNWADLIVVDMKREYKIDSSLFVSKAKYSPFDGMDIKGMPIKTFVNGNLIMDSGKIVAKPGNGLVITNDLF